MAEALAFYGRLFELPIREHVTDETWIDLGDQVLALFERDGYSRDAERHFGLVVDDLEAVRRGLAELGLPHEGDQLDFHDPWGNRVQVCEYGSVMFRKDPDVLRGMGL